MRQRLFLESTNHKPREPLAGRHFPRLRTELEDATRQRKEAEAAAPDLEAATAVLERARSIVKRADEDRQSIRLELGKLDTSIGIHAGEAVDEDLTDIDIRLEAARTALHGLKFEVAVLRKLSVALEMARASARNLYVEPVMKETRNLSCGLFWPEAELRLDPETLLPTALVRTGTEEHFDILSGGTQEQIALLVRLAFARMFAKDRRTGAGHPRRRDRPHGRRPHRADVRCVDHAKPTISRSSCSPVVKKPFVIWEDAASISCLQHELQTSDEMKISPR